MYVCVLPAVRHLAAVAPVLFLFLDIGRVSDVVQRFDADSAFADLSPFAWALCSLLVTLLLAWLVDDRLRKPLARKLLRHWADADARLGSESQPLLVKS